MDDGADPASAAAAAFAAVGPSARIAARSLDACTDAAARRRPRRASSLNPPLTGTPRRRRLARSAPSAATTRTTASRRAGARAPYEADNLIDASCQELEEQTARNEKRERLKSIRQSCAITPSDAAGLASELGAAPPDLVRTLSDPAMPSPAKKKPL